MAGIGPAVAKLHFANAIGKQREMADRSWLDIADHRFIAAEMIKRGDIVAKRDWRGDIIELEFVSRGKRNSAYGLVLRRRSGSFNGLVHRAPHKLQGRTLTRK